MGQKKRYSITITPEIPKEFIDEFKLDFKENTGFDYDNLDLPLNKYDLLDGIKKISQSWVAYYFEIKEAGDLWVAYVKNGASKEAKAKVILPTFKEIWRN